MERRAMSLDERVSRRAIAGVPLGGTYHDGGVPVMTMNLGGRQEQEDRFYQSLRAAIAVMVAAQGTAGDDEQSADDEQPVDDEQPADPSPSLTPDQLGL